MAAAASVTEPLAGWGNTSRSTAVVDFLSYSTTWIIQLWPSVGDGMKTRVSTTRSPESSKRAKRLLWNVTESGSKHNTTHFAATFSFISCLFFVFSCQPFCFFYSSWYFSWEFCTNGPFFFCLFFLAKTIYFPNSNQMQPDHKQKGCYDMRCYQKVAANSTHCQWSGCIWFGLGKDIVLAKKYKKTGAICAKLTTKVICMQKDKIIRCVNGPYAWFWFC